MKFAKNSQTMVNQFLNGQDRMAFQNILEIKKSTFDFLKKQMYIS